MPSSIADPLYERLLRAYPADRAYTRDDWTDAPMPSPVQHFLVQLLRHQCRHEVQRLHHAQTDWVEYDHPEMERIARRYTSALAKYGQIPRGEWPGALKQATHHVTSFLVRPTHVLTEFVFGDVEELGLGQVHWRMEFFGPYDYLREAVAAFTEQRNLRRVQRDQFDRLLHRIDERLTQGYDAARWLRLLDPLFKISRVATDSDKVPVRLLLQFFQDKDAGDVVRCLTSFAASGPDHIGPKQLYRLVEDDAERRNREDDRVSRSSPASSGASRSGANASPTSQRSGPTPDAPTQSERSTEPSPPPPPAQSTPDERPDVPPLQSPRSSTSEPSQLSAGASSETSTDKSSSPPAPDDEPDALDSSSEASEPERAPWDPEHPAHKRDPEDRTSKDRTSEHHASDPNDADYDDSDHDDHDDIWGVAGPARPAGSPSQSLKSEDESTPLWKRFQQGAGASSSSPVDPSDGGDNGTPLWARFQSSRESGSAQRIHDSQDSRAEPDASPGRSGRAPSAAPDDTPDDTPDDVESTPSTPEPSQPPPASRSSSPSQTGDTSSQELTTLEEEVLGACNPPQRAVYVRQLFGGSMDDYRHVLNRLRSASGWGEASQVIAREVFRAHKVNIYSDAAVHFTNAVEDRFRNG